MSAGRVFRVFCQRRNCGKGSQTCLALFTTDDSYAYHLSVSLPIVVKLGILLLLSQITSFIQSKDDNMKAYLNYLAKLKLITGD